MNIQNILDRVKKTAIKSIWTNGGAPVPVITQNTKKFWTTCCAMAIYSMTNETTVKEISFLIERQKEEAKLFWEPASRASGEKNLIVITTPTEHQLEENLKKCGFNCIANNLKRRNGYPGGNLKMWMLILD